MALQTKPQADARRRWLDAAVVMRLLFLTVLLHEFGHCFGARSVGGDATDVLLWPLGGLASVEVPQNPRANLVTAAAGPFVNFVLCVLCGLLLYFAVNVQPIWNPLDGYVHRGNVVNNHQVAGMVQLFDWDGQVKEFLPYSPQVLLVNLFYVNWLLMLINMVLIGFPLDGGRIFQSILWFFFTYRQATFAAVIVGFVVAVIVGLYAIVQQEVLAAPA